MSQHLRCTAFSTPPRDWPPPPDNDDFEAARIELGPRAAFIEIDTRAHEIAAARASAEREAA
jgi:hypothetical protein